MVGHRLGAYCNRMIRNSKEVLINNLMNESVFEMNLNRNYIDSQIIRIIIPSNDQKATLYSIRRSRTQTAEVHFKRIYQCRIYSVGCITEQSRVIYLMESKNSNNVLFDRNMEHRDDGTITIGTFVRIMAPQAIENRMNGDVPLVKTPHPLIVMKRPTVLPTVSIINEVQIDRSLAFVLNNRQLNVNQTFAVSTTCGGNHCDKQRCGDWNGIKGCGCFAMNQNCSNLVLVHSIWVYGSNKNRIMQTEFSSTKFSLTYLKQRIPSMIQKSALQQSNAFWDIEDCIEAVVDFVNENGGFTIVGWYKRGSIKDKSLIEAGNTSTNEDIIASGQLNYHIVEVLPTNQELLDPNSRLGMEMHKLKYDVSGLNHA